MAGQGGAVREPGTPAFVVDISKRINQLNYRMKLQSQSYEEISRLAVSKSEELKHLPAIKPLSARMVINCSTFLAERRIAS